jgi:hypothetical protein
MIVITTPTCSDLLHPPLPALQPPVALPIFSRSSAFGSHSINRRGVGEHLPALVSGFPPSMASQESGLTPGVSRSLGYAFCERVPFAPDHLVSQRLPRKS